jgi:hypothetical protein
MSYQPVLGLTVLGLRFFHNSTSPIKTLRTFRRDEASVMGSHLKGYEASGDCTLYAIQLSQKVYPNRAHGDACAALPYLVVCRYYTDPQRLFNLYEYSTIMVRRQAHSRISERSVSLSSILLATQEPDLDVWRKYG